MEDSTYGSAEVVARTGLSGALLRTWEQRYEFPRPTRVGSGRRRYSEADVQALLDVKRRRDSGMRLAAAIADVRRGPTAAGESLYVHARDHWPRATVHRLDKKMVLALSNAIEDECHASARSALLFGLFQDESGFRAAEPRWKELAKSARVAMVFADFEAGSGTPLPGDPVSVSLPPSSPLLAEWAVIVDGVEMPVALVAREALHDPRRSDRQPQFDMIWTLEPDEVRDVARQCVRLAAAAGVDVPPAAREALAQPAHAAGAPGPAAAALVGRTLGYAAHHD